MNFHQLQHEVGKWSRKNFPDNKPYHPLLGVGEEVGELMHAFLKMEQGIRGNEDHVAAKEDAVADIIIYLADYCERDGISMGMAVAKTWDKVKQRDWQANKDDAHMAVAVTAEGPWPGDGYCASVGLSHSWSEWLLRTTYKRRICDNCGKSEVQSLSLLNLKTIKEVLAQVLSRYNDWRGNEQWDADDEEAFAIGKQLLKEVHSACQS